MRKVFLVLIIGIMTISLSYAENKPMQVRLVLNEKEAENEPYEIFDYKINTKSPPEKIFVSHNVVLSNEDIDEIYIIRAEDRYKQYPETVKTAIGKEEKTLVIPHAERKGWYETPELTIVFNEEGAKKLEEFSRANSKKSCAIVFDEKVLCVTKMMFPLTAGKIGIESTEIPTDIEAIEIVGQSGFEPKFIYE